jgi:tRNA (adenine-N(1)-)-methyltransferase non-catalytic subunit
MPGLDSSSADTYSTIQPCKNFIVQLPSENYKIVDLKPNSYFPGVLYLIFRTISLGKFGSFHADALIGKPFGPSWEILPNKEIRLLEREEQDEEGKEELD